ncbi:MAG: SIS domain-containing protein, partial [Planctomycetes bacterium]|nr:SIS domain-containing protein [Planctomycetota bacterium]
MNNFLDNIRDHISVVRQLQRLNEDVLRVAEILVCSLRKGGKIMFCGNGGSAADCQHLAAEFTGRFLNDRRPLAAI